MQHSTTRCSTSQSNRSASSQIPPPHPYGGPGLSRGGEGGRASSVVPLVGTASAGPLRPQSTTTMHHHQHHQPAARVTPDLNLSYHVYDKPTLSVLHLQPGRSVGHNLRRQPSPEPHRRFLTTILFDGCESYAAMKQRDAVVERTKVLSEEQLHQRRMDEQARYAAEYESAVRRELLLNDQQRQQQQEQQQHQDGVVEGNNVSLVGGGGSRPHSQQSMAAAATAGEGTLLTSQPSSSSVLLRRAITPLQQTRRTLRRVEEAKAAIVRANTPTIGCSRSVLPAGISTAPHRYQPHLPVDLDCYINPREAGYDEQLGPRVIATSNVKPADEVTLLSRPHESLRSLPHLQTPEAVGLTEGGAEHSGGGGAGAEHDDEQQHMPPPPKLILVLFRFENVRNLPATHRLREIGYPVLHEQFSAAAERGCLTRQQYTQVIKRYLSPREMVDGLKILQCFDRSATGDVELNAFLLGMQILLRCATAFDTLRYGFSLIESNSRVPRYITRFEAQSLLNAALDVRRDKRAALVVSGLSEVVEEEVGDAEFTAISGAIEELMSESWRYDYMGRIGLQTFFAVLDEKMTQRLANNNSAPVAAKSGRTSPPPAPSPRAWGEGSIVAEAEAHLRSPRKTDTNPYGTAGEVLSSIFKSHSVAAAHRMSSLKMLYESLRYQPTNALKDPHRVVVQPEWTKVNNNSSSNNNRSAPTPNMKLPKFR